MSSMDSGSVIGNEGRAGRRWPGMVLALGILLAVGAAIYFEPLFTLERIRQAAHAGDEIALRRMVDPEVIDDRLVERLEATRARRGTRVEWRYEGFSRFLVLARPENRNDPTWRGLVGVFLALERRGLTWQLVDVQWADPLAIGGGPAGPPFSSPPPDDSLPPFGTYVYVELLPQVERRVAPIYPEPARNAGVEGLVMVQALVGKDGRVRDTRIATSIPMLDAAAVEAVRQWRFKPAQAGGKPVAVWVAVPVKFTLR